MNGKILRFGENLKINENGVFISCIRVFVAFCGSHASELFYSCCFLGKHRVELFYPFLLIKLEPIKGGGSPVFRLLIVDDEDNTREGIAERICWIEAGISQIEQADDGVNALKKAAEFRPDIILTDVRMPRMDGIDL